jgi:hypothetical protein
MMWVVMRVARWDFEPISHIPCKMVTTMAGYLPVYDTMEEAQKDYPDGPFKEIKTAGEESK